MILYSTKNNCRLYSQNVSAHKGVEQNLARYIQYSKLTTVVTKLHTPSHSVHDTFRLFKDFLLHEVVITAYKVGACAQMNQGRIQNLGGTVDF